jgi:hypothetical protein
MKSRAHSIALHLAKVATRKAFVILVLSSLAVVTAGTGVWANKVYADKVKAEKVAHEQAINLDDVMAKLNRMESEMQVQTRALNEKMESIEYQNAKLAAYTLRERDHVAKLELAAERLASPAFPPAPALGFSGGLSVESKLCMNKEASIGFKGTPAEVGAEAMAQGNVGLDEFGDGVEATARGRFRLHGELELNGDGAFSIEHCLVLPTVDISESSASLSSQSGFSELAPESVSSVRQEIRELQAGSPQLAQKLLSVASNINQFGATGAANTIDQIQNASVTFSPANLLKVVDDPTTAFQDVQGFLDQIPLPGNLGDLFKGPASLFPQASDLNPANFCANFNSGGTGPISTFCSQVPSVLADLKGIGQTIGDLSNVQVDLANFKTGVTNLCGSVEGAVSNLNSTSIQVPTLASFTFIDGVSFVPPGVTKKTVTIGPATISNPIQLPTISCPSF